VDGDDHASTFSRNQREIRTDQDELRRTIPFWSRSDHGSEFRRGPPFNSAASILVALGRSRFLAISSRLNDCFDRRVCFRDSRCRDRDERIAPAKSRNFHENTFTNFVKKTRKSRSSTSTYSFPQDRNRIPLAVRESTGPFGTGPIERDVELVSPRRPCHRSEKVT
jgi:hypothetical protein